jgi:hypothetical protein
MRSLKATSWGIEVHSSEDVAVQTGIQPSPVCLRSRARLHRPKVSSSASACIIILKTSISRLLRLSPSTHHALFLTDGTQFGQGITAKRLPCPGMTAPTESQPLSERAGTCRQPRVRGAAASIFIYLSDLLHKTSNTKHSCHY